MKLPPLAPTPRLIILAAAASLALGACKKDDDQPKAAAGGELLPRSVTDDMLPYDTVRSQASLSPPDDAVYDDVTAPRRPSVSASAAAEDDVVSDAVPVIDPAPPAPAQ